MGIFFSETFNVRESPFIKCFCWNGMNDTYWERLLISTMDIVEMQKEMQKIEALATAV